MSQSLETPCTEDSSNWAALYRARGDEITEHRPVLTGDVFDKTTVFLASGESKVVSVLVVQHPCAVRVDGVDLIPRLLVARYRPHRVVPPEVWNGYYKLIPLPELRPDQTYRN